MHISIIIYLLFTGIRIIIDPIRKEKKDAVNIKTLSYKESISIGIALALDDIGGAVGVGLLGYSAFAVASAFFTVSFLIFLTGNYLIKTLRKLKISQKLTTVLAGLLMIAIGISQVM